MALPVTAELMPKAVAGTGVDCLRPPQWMTCPGHQAGSPEARQCWVSGRFDNSRLRIWTRRDRAGAFSHPPDRSTASLAAPVSDERHHGGRSCRHRGPRCRTRHAHCAAFRVRLTHRVQYHSPWVSLQPQHGRSQQLRGACIDNRPVQRWRARGRLASVARGRTARGVPRRETPSRGCPSRVLRVGGQPPDDLPVQDGRGVGDPA